MSRLTTAVLITGMLTTPACTPVERDQADAAESAPVVDSIFPVEEQVRRFQATVADTATAFRGGAASRDALVDAFLSAVESRDLDALAPLTLDRGEYAFLYYPHSRFAAPPYELPPDILWLQIQNTQSRSLTRLFRQLEERQLDPRGHRCEGDPIEAGPVRIWEDCFVLVPGASEPIVDLRLFGSILEHGGVFKFLSLSNGL